jgi:Alpha-L-arabinofuranosidase B (ABFB) domain
MEDPGVSSGVSSGEDPEKQHRRLVRPYVGSGDPASLQEANDGNASAWFPAAPVGQESAPPSAPATAAEHPGGAAGRHRLLPSTSHRFRSTSAATGVAAAGIAALTVGVFLVWPGHPGTVLSRNCRPDSCGGTVSQPLGSAPAAVSAGTGSPPAGSSTPQRRGTAAQATASTRSTRTRSATAATAASANATPIATATAGTAATATAGGTAVATATAGSSPSAPPATSAPQPTPGSVISINATTACCTMFYIRHDDADDRVVITQITAGSSALDKADATWIVQAGLADSACISFESANDPGQYLRHFDFELYLEPNDGSAQFAQDATFCPRPGNSGQGYSFQSVNYPTQYIRHYNYVVYIASDGGSNPWDNNLSVWPEDTTWLVTQPWGNS